VCRKMSEVRIGKCEVGKNRNAMAKSTLNKSEVFTSIQKYPTFLAAKAAI